MREMDLDDKLIRTDEKINEWYEEMNGNVYVAFSGGKDSTVLSYLVASTLNRYRDKRYQLHLVYMDTGLEYPEIKVFTRQFTKYLQEAFPNLVIDLERVVPKMPFNKVIERFGYPVVSKRIAEYVATAKRNPNSYRARCLRGEESTIFVSPKWAYLIDAPFKIDSYCCTVMKKQPANAYVKRTGRFPMTAVMGDESKTRWKEWLRTGCNAYAGEHKMSKPMSFWTEQNVLEYIYKFKLPICSVYGEVIQNTDGTFDTTGVKRTGCIYCMFGVHRECEPNRFQQLKKTHPLQYDYCMKPIGEGG